MKALVVTILTLLTLVMSSLSTDGFTEVRSAAPTCADFVHFDSVSKEDSPSFKLYLIRGCERIPDGKKLVKPNIITLRSVDEWMIPTLCRNPRAKACTYRLDKDRYIIYNPIGTALYLSHEILHIIMWEQGIEDGEEHHKIMLENGWYH